MNLSINGQSQVPPGFRFHPTEEELLHYYLKKKVVYEKIDLDVIQEVDLNKLEPWDIQEKCRIGSAPQNDWYFFSHKDKKYPTGTRTNRATAAGFWKATGRDKIIYSGCKRIGLRKTLVFYKGRAPHGQKSDWIMHEYRLEESNQEQNALASPGDTNMPEEGWVVCRVFKKKNYQKALDSPGRTTTTSMDSKLQLLCSAGANQAGVLDQILSYMGRTTAPKAEKETTPNLKYPQNINNNSNNKYQFQPANSPHQERFIHLPRLERPNFDDYHSIEEMMLAEPDPAPSPDAATPDNSEPLLEPTGLSGWAALDRLVASQLNGHGKPIEPPGQPFCCFVDDEVDLHRQLHDQVRPSRASNNVQGMELLGSCESDFFWSNFVAKSSSSSSSSGPLRHLSV